MLICNLILAGRKQAWCLIEKRMGVFPKILSSLLLFGSGMNELNLDLRIPE
jgi:hypothetical protein